MNPTLSIILICVACIALTAAPEGTARDLQCEPLAFPGVSATAWSCIKAKLAGNNISVSDGTSGDISGSFGAARFRLDTSTNGLSITLVSTSYSCAVGVKYISEVVDSCRDFERVTPNSTRTHWRIDSPNVKQPVTNYEQIVFRGGDVVTVTAGGCVQHGGPGKTWSLYVDPQKPNTSRDFYGQIRLPGMPAMQTLKEFLAEGGTYTVPRIVVGEKFLKLGFTDFRYADNGYWGRAR